MLDLLFGGLAVGHHRWSPVTDACTRRRDSRRPQRPRTRPSGRHRPGPQRRDHPRGPGRHLELGTVSSAAAVGSRTATNGSSRRSTRMELSAFAALSAGRPRCSPPCMWPNTSSWATPPPPSAHRDAPSTPPMPSSPVPRSANRSTSWPRGVERATSCTSTLPTTRSSRPRTGAPSRSRRLTFYGRHSRSAAPTCPPTQTRIDEESHAKAPTRLAAQGGVLTARLATRTSAMARAGNPIVRLPRPELTL